MPSILSGHKTCHSPKNGTPRTPKDSILSGRRDSNTRPPVPQTVALPGCATPRLALIFSKASAKVLLFFELRKIFMLFFKKK